MLNNTNEYSSNKEEEKEEEENDTESNGKCKCNSEQKCAKFMTHCLENKKRQCKLHHLSYTRDKYNHEYVGPAYKCEECHCTGDRECLYDDNFELRLEDGIFICYDCYRLCQIIADIG